MIDSPDDNRAWVTTGATPFLTVATAEAIASRVLKVSDSGQAVYQAEKQACRAFPDPKGDGTQAGVKRNFQILPPLDFLAHSWRVSNHH